MNKLQSTTDQLANLCSKQPNKLHTIDRAIAIQKLVPGAFKHGKVKVTSFGWPENPETYTLVVTLGNGHVAEYPTFFGNDPAIPEELILPKILNDIRLFNPIWYSKYTGSK